MKFDMKGSYCRNCGNGNYTIFAPPQNFNPMVYCNHCQSGVERFQEILTEEDIKHDLKNQN
jgi:hypothetical protein